MIPNSISPLLRDNTVLLKMVLLLFLIRVVLMLFLIMPIQDYVSVDVLQGKHKKLTERIETEHTVQSIA